MQLHLLQTLEKTNLIGNDGQVHGCFGAEMLKEFTEKEKRTLLIVIKTFRILIVLVITWVYTFVQTH